MVNIIIWCYLASEMAEVKNKKKQPYSGKNVRISETAFYKIKAFVDEKGWKLGRFIEDAGLEKLQKEKK